MERRTLEEGALDLVAFCADDLQWLESKDRRSCGQLIMLAPTRISEAERLTAAIARDAPWAALVGRAVSIVHSHCPLNAALEEGLAIQRVHLLARECLLQEHPGLGKLSAHNAYIRHRHRRCLLLEEAQDISRQLRIREVAVQVTQPEGVGALRCHGAWPVRGHILRCGPTALGRRHAEPS